MTRGFLSDCSEQSPFECYRNRDGMTDEEQAAIASAVARGAVKRIPIWADSSTIDAPSQKQSASKRGRDAARLSNSIRALSKRRRDGGGG